MDIASLLVELYDRIPPLARGSLDGVPLAQLSQSPSPTTNSIAWLVWHLARVQDHHVAELLGAEQVWTGDDWAARFGLQPDPSNTGYGHLPEDVGMVRPARAASLLEYLDAVYGRTRPWLRTLGAGDLEGIVDRRWDPPVSLGVRLVSIADDSLQHAGQAAYVRGLLLG